MDSEIRNMIRQMNAANPLWCALRIHGELLERDIEIKFKMDCPNFGAYL